MLTKGRSLDRPFAKRAAPDFFGRKKQRNPVVVGDPRLRRFELQNKSVVGADRPLRGFSGPSLKPQYKRPRAFRGAMGLRDCPGFDGFSPVSSSYRGHRGGPENYYRALTTTLTYEIQQTHSSLGGFGRCQLG